MAITARQRSLFAKTLFLRSRPLFSPGLWKDALADAPRVGAAAAVFFEERAANFVSRANDAHKAEFLGVVVSNSAFHSVVDDVRAAHGDARPRGRRAREVEKGRRRGLGRAGDERRAAGRGDGADLGARGLRPHGRRVGANSGAPVRRRRARRGGLWRRAGGVGAGRAALAPRRPRRSAGRAANAARRRRCRDDGRGAPARADRGDGAGGSFRRDSHARAGGLAVRRPRGRHAAELSARRGGRGERRARLALVDAIARLRGRGDGRRRLRGWAMSLSPISSSFKAAGPSSSPACS